MRLCLSSKAGSKHHRHTTESAADTRACSRRATSRFEVARSVTRSCGAWFEAQQHPGRAELVAQHRETRGKERVLHPHVDLAAFGKDAEDPVRLLIALDREGQVRAADGLELARRNIRAEKFGL